MKPRDRSKNYVITIAVLLVFSVGLYILRLIVRKPFTPAFGLDDGIITVGVVWRSPRVQVESLTERCRPP